jgi:phosphatidylglycerol:prolipoprotein diacylglycerol transferase
LAGCCYGIETASPLGLIFPESSMAPSGIRLFPIQPISSALDFLNFFVLVLISKKTKATGQVAGFYLIFYSLGRFIVEFFRGDLIRGTVGILSTSQFISVFPFLAGVGIVIIRGLQSKKAHALASTEEAEETSDQENEE